MYIHNWRRRFGHRWRGCKILQRLGNLLKRLRPFPRVRCVLSPWGVARHEDLTLSGQVWCNFSARAIATVSRSCRKNWRNRRSRRLRAAPGALSTAMFDSIKLFLKKLLTKGNLFERNGLGGGCGSDEEERAVSGQGRA